MAEWLCSGLQSRLRRFDSGFSLQSNGIFMKVGIVGYGFVGKALHYGIRDQVDVIKVDPKLGSSVEDLRNQTLDYVFVCISTPMENDGSQSIENILNVFEDIKKNCPETIIVLKSTVVPENIEKLAKIDPDFIYNPEFLRENHANEDFINSKLIIFGGNKKISASLGNFYSNFTLCETKEYIFTDHVSASFVKYTINVFLATKVVFFNEIFNLFQASNANLDWEDFIKILSNDPRIGSSHMQVPGPDGRFGFGGACLPKDLSAIMKFADSLGIKLNVLNAVNICNNNIRASYNTNTERENEQNISYKADEEKN